MPARRCLSCKINWPYRKGSAVACPECGEALQYSSHAMVTKLWPLEIPKVLPEPTREVEDEIAGAWESVRAEATRREGHFSMADIIGEGDPRTLR